MVLRNSSRAICPNTLFRSCAVLRYTSILCLLVILTAAVTAGPADARKGKAESATGFLTKTAKVKDQTFKYAVFVPA